jgi:hypothetical protein
VKKLAIGCGLALFITGIAAAGVAVYLYRQVSLTVSQFAAFGSIPKLEGAVWNQSPFTPPPSEVLTEAQLQKLIRVQTRVREKLGRRATALEAKYRVLADKREATLADTATILNAYRDMGALWMEAKRTQVQALNSFGLSLEEYRWIRHQAYRAVGEPFLDLDIGRIVEDLERGVRSQAVQVRGAIGPAGPDANRQLVQKVKKLLEQNLPLASLGL